MNLIRRHRRVRTLRMPDGTLVKLVETVHPDANTRQIEHWDEHVDAQVMPAPLIIPIRTKRYL